VRRRGFFDRMRVLMWRTALGPAIVIWGFGYVLLDIVSTLTGRASPGVTFVTAIPMLVLGVCQTEALDMIRSSIRRAHFVLRGVALLAATLVAAAIQSLFDLYWIRYLALTVFPDWQIWALQINSQRLSTTAIVYLWTFCLALALLWAARASRASDVNAARAAEAEASAAKAHSAALRLQLNPHFLFNTMNSISSLVALDRKDEAEDMIERLCDFLRASLNADPMEDVPLSQEIDAIDAYLSIEATRFGDRLHIDIDIAPEVAEVPVPNFILQPLVENAIKHGVSAVKGQATLTIAAARDGDDLVLTVLNEAAEPDGASSVSTSGTGIGLSNSRQRLANRYGDRAGLHTQPTAKGYHAQVRLPLTA
jgi:two-component system, LytTR family, sensor kinase